MLNVLEHAAVAAQQKNWSLLNQYLQQLPLKTFTNTAQADTDLEEILALALEVLEAGDFHERWEVAKVFPRLGTVAIAPLINILEDEEEDWELRWFAVRILGEFDNPAAIAALVDLLQTSDNQDLTEMAAAALANLGSSAVAALTELLADEETRVLAVRSLSYIRRSETIAPLLSVVCDPEVPVRVAAIEALSSFHDKRIPPVLLNALQDLAAPVRREAVVGLGLRSDLQEELDLVNQLRSLLWDFNIDVCAAAAIALGRMGTDDAANALFQVLQSPNTPMPLQLESIRALGWVGTPKAIEYLQQALISLAKIESRSIAEITQFPINNHPLPITNSPINTTTTAQEIVAVLGRVEQSGLIPKAAEILIDAFKTDHPSIQQASVKQALAVSLGQLADPAGIDSLIEMLADADEGVRWHAIAALKKFPTAFQKLELLADDENLTPMLKEGVVIALENFKF